jgi:hypothetical protein
MSDVLISRSKNVALYTQDHSSHDRDDSEYLKYLDLSHTIDTYLGDNLCTQTQVRDDTFSEPLPIMRKYVGFQNAALRPAHIGGCFLFRRKAARHIA